MRNRDLRNQDLRGADLRSADLRGALLDGANLREADLREVRTGMRRGWAALVVTAAVALSLACGVAAGLAGRFLQRVFTTGRPEMQALALFVASMLLVYLIFAAIKGLYHASRTVLPVLAAVPVVAAGLAIVTGHGTGRGALVALAFLLAAAAIMGLGVLARVVAGAAGMVLFATAALSGALVGSVLGGGLTATAIAITAMIDGRHALKGSQSYPVVGRIAAQIACKGGTSFRGADVSGATFERARLHCCDFRGATIEGTQFAPAEVRLCLFDGGPPEAVRPSKPARQRPLDLGQPRSDAP